jgi:iron complex outermembrane recepter protein
MKKLTIILLIFVSTAFARLLSKESNHIVIINDVINVYGTFLPRTFFNEASSTSIKSKESIEKYQANHIEELVYAIPNMNLSKGSSRGQFFQIRGIGERAAYEAMTNYSVGLMLDDIDYSGIASIANLSGVSQVEVYKGPEATRFGPSALAGMIYITSKEPKSIVEGDIKSSYSSFNTFEESVNYSGPIGENHKVALNISKKDSNGNITNSFLNKEDTNSQDELGVKVKLLGNYKGTKVTLAGHYFDIENGYDAFSHNNSLVTKSDRPGRDTQESLAQMLKMDKKFHENIRSTSILTHLKSKSVYSYDEDWGNNQEWITIPGWNAPYDYNVSFSRAKEDFTLDQRLFFNEKFTLGLYFKKSDEKFREHGFENGVSSKDLRGTTETNNKALYFENIFEISSDWSLSYGSRVEGRDTEYKDNVGLEISPSETMFGGKIILKHQVTEKSLNYFQISKGYKSGGINTQSVVPMERKNFRQEKLYSFEMGNKNTWENLNMQTGVGIFYMYRDDVQVKTSFQDDPLDPNSYSFYTDNATKGRNYGVEFEAQLSPIKGLTVDSSCGLLKSVYGQYEIGNRKLLGREMPHAPEYQFNINLKYELSSGLYSVLNYFSSDNFYFSNSHDQQSTSYQLIDIKVGFKKGKWDFSIWSKNVFNEYYAQRGYYFSNEPPNWTDKLYVQRGQPRTVGLTAHYLF